MREVTLDAFAGAHADGAVVIDVREPYEYATGHVPGARLVPLAQLGLHADELPRTERVYLICATGNRSLVAADYLARYGIDAISVAGGTSGWQGRGWPVHRGMRSSTATL
jgi:rhodanese-related sulfurtransferase